MFLPVVIGKLGSNRSKLSRKVALRPDTKPAFKGIRNGLEMLRFVVPKVGAAGIFPAARICHVEDISQPWSFTVGINKSNALRAAPDVPPHFLIPQVIFRTGGSFRPLCENKELLMERVLIQTCGGGQKSSPLLVAAGDLRRGIVCHLRKHQGFTRHRCPPFPQNSPATAPARQTPHQTLRGAS